MVHFVFNSLKLRSGLSEVVSKDRFVPGSLKVGLTGEPSAWNRRLETASECPLGSPDGTHYSGVTLNVARPDMNNYATLKVMLY